MNDLLIGAAAGVGACALAHRVFVRLRLSRAKHPSLRGHAKMSRRLSKLLPYYGFASAEEAFACDGADSALVTRRVQAFEELASELKARAPEALRLGAELSEGMSDVAFTDAYRVPFQFRDLVRRSLPPVVIAEESDGVRVRDRDGNWSYDVAGSYGVNLFGSDFYKECIARASERVAELGPYLGRYHPIVVDNVRRLKEISGMDQVSFHMSGTEAVMQAVRLARYHTGRPRAVRFCGAYHGWWDGVQPGVGNPRKVHDVYTLEEGSDVALQVLRTRKDIACVLINPLQALHLNAGAASDASLVARRDGARFDREAYAEWLGKLREVCDENEIAMIVDDVFLGFRLAKGGTQEYFGVEADIVTYGKTLGGGFPVGVVCGRQRWMKRFRDERPTDICFARGTFNSHPYVMAAMHEFLVRLDRAEIQALYASADQTWRNREAVLNARLQEDEFPLRVSAMLSVFTVRYIEPGRFHWLFQYYLRAEGLALSWIGTGRFIFSHDYTDADFTEVCDCIVRAARRMRAAGYWGAPGSAGGASESPSIRRQMLRELVSARFAARGNAKPKRRGRVAACLQAAWRFVGHSVIGSRSSPRST